MIISLIIAVVVIALFPFVVRWVFALIGFAAVLFIVVAARAQPTSDRTPVRSRSVSP